LLSKSGVIGFLISVIWWGMSIDPNLMEHIRQWDLQTLSGWTADPINFSGSKIVLIKIRICIKIVLTCIDNYNIRANHLVISSFVWVCLMLFLYWK